MNSPVIIPRAEHCVSRSDISESALKVLYRLHQAGFKACLVGGCVRDLLLGRHPKDFDVATDALPEEVRKLFGNCRLIGRRFRLAHVRFGREIIEVATFRGDPAKQPDSLHDHEINSSGMIARDNVYGALEEDVWRRDFTVNALYYNIADFSIIDYVGGAGDIEARLLRLIGEPQQRYREDPVRLLRAVRFAAKLEFSIAPQSEQPIAELGYLLGDVSAARLFEEVLKLFHSGHALQGFRLLRRYDLLQWLFPETALSLEGDNAEQVQGFIEQAMANTDQRIAAGLPVNPAFMFACLLWHPLRSYAQIHAADGAPSMADLTKAIPAALAEQTRIVAIPKRFIHVIREIWQYQSRLECAGGTRALALLQQRRFRAAYDFLCLRAACGEEVYQRCDWWTQMQTLDKNAQEEMALAMSNRNPKRARKANGQRRGRRRRVRKST